MEDDYKVIGGDIQGDNQSAAELSAGFESSTPVTGENVGLVTRVHCSTENIESGSSDNVAEADAYIEGLVLFYTPLVNLISKAACAYEKIIGVIQF